MTTYLALVLIIFLQPLCALADEQQPVPDKAAKDREVRLYRTNAERREIGLKHQILPWFTASTLLELEGLIEDFNLKKGDDDNSNREGAATLQLGLIATPWESVKGELLLEYDTDAKELVADEAFVALEADPWELEAGTMYTPFGTYISHFATGPLLEFGETRAPGVKLSYGPDDRVDFALSAYRGRARKAMTDSRLWDWAFALEAWPRDTLFLGLSYQSNLADANSRLLSGYNDRYLQKVDGASGYLVWSTDLFEVSLEALGALRTFRELDPDRDRPIAWNLEFVHFIDSRFEWALRLEGSQELEDAPELQYGAAFTWRTGAFSSLTLEYLRGQFRGELATNDDDRPYNHVDRFGAQFSIAF